MNGVVEVRLIQQRNDLANEIFNIIDRVEDN
jgi:hypothetical protein